MFPFDGVQEWLLNNVRLTFSFFAPGTRQSASLPNPCCGKRAPIVSLHSAGSHPAGAVKPLTARWGVPDPAAVEGSDEQKRRAFSITGNILLNRIRLFVSLPLAKLDRLGLAKKLSDIGNVVTPNDAAA
jgi:hypothetical protein